MTQDMTAHGVEASEDIDEIADILTDAFRDTPVTSWMVPHDVPRRERYITAFMHTWVRFMIRHEGTALISPGGDAVVVWEPSERAPVTAEAHDAFRADVAAVTGPAAGRCLALMDLVDAHYPPDLPPHIHGALAAVRPGGGNQGAFLGLAVATLHYIHPRKLGVYCEGSSDESTALWERMGATPIAPKFRIPHSDIALTPLFMHPDDIARHPAVPALMSAATNGAQIPAQYSAITRL
ncbi:hypothetical protein LO772_00725 [Yinghuangia sp. ASG 101]|uniref:hypothetical protein n=1 Tax=Yinghuangia sp. ASG 101 TaxID=2896848 RepID=UPI001E50B954|nr:hypothetical protein [Yinghuangia sp. ASG 101]UGQ12168.1 hypothetical protein LO772_00725 [Yinghuangia sp. ASG 101]